MRHRDAPVQGSIRLASGRTSMVPFLPTLVTALVIGGLSLLCREPKAPAPVAPAASMTMVVDAAAPAAGSARDAVEWPASLLLAQLPPPVMAEPGAAALAAPPPAKVANRRSCAGARCETRRSIAARPAPAPASAPARPAPDPMVARRDASEPERTGALPDDALPFAPTGNRVWDAARVLGGRVVAIGSSVSDVLPSLN